MKKRMIVSAWLVAAVVVFLLSFFLTKQIVARKNPAEETEALETFSENEELSYIKWSYNGWQTDWEDDHNLTSTDTCTAGHMYAEGALLIDSWEEYQTLLSMIEKKELLLFGIPTGCSGFLLQRQSLLTIPVRSRGNGRCDCYRNLFPGILFQ